jgi:hypothetical protein
MRPERPQRFAGALGSSEQWQGDRGESGAQGGGSLSGRPPRGDDK